MPDSELSDWMRQLFADTEDRDAAIQTAWQHVERAGLVSKVTVHRYICDRCGPLATVIRLGDDLIAYVRDYKLSPGMNRDKSVETARSRNTLDGKRHWPSHAYDLNTLATGGPQAGFDVVCRHIATTVRAVDAVRIADGIRPGHPGRPTRL